MNEQELFVKSNQALKDIVVRVELEYLDRALPVDMIWIPDQTLRGAINICAYENRCVADVLAGKDKLPSNAELREDLLGDSPKDSYTRFSDEADRAARNLDDPDRIVHISYGDFPAREYLRDITIQRSLSAYDIARFIDVDARMPEDVVKGLWEIINPMAKALREIGVFGPRIDVPESAPLEDRLLGLTGRQPSSRRDQ